MLVKVALLKRLIAFARWFSVCLLSAQGYIEIRIVIGHRPARGHQSPR